MLERILLAIVTTFCIYLFLNLGGKSSQTPTFNAQKFEIPNLVDRIAPWAW